MKEKFKNAKGITLVALIITIIVLLILAVVAISSINNNKIIEYAKNGKDDYRQGETNETEKMNEYERYLEDNSSNSNSFNFPYYGNVYSCNPTDTATHFYIINKDNIRFFITMWRGSSSNFGNFPETTYDDFGVSVETMSYKFLDLNTAIEEYINNLPQDQYYESNKSWAENIKNSENLDSKVILTENNLIFTFKNNYQMIR